MRGIDGAKFSLVDAFLQQTDDPLADRLNVLGEDALQMGGAAAAGAHQLAHENVSVVRRLGNGIEVRLHVGQKAFAGRARTIADRHHPLQQAFEETIEHRAVERLLVVEVVIQQRLVHPGGFGDSIDPGARQAFAAELHQRGLQDGLAATVGLAAAAAGWDRGMGLGVHLIN